jgi:hypothetical protein
MTLNCTDGTWDWHGRWAVMPRHHMGLDCIKEVYGTAVAEYIRGVVTGAPLIKNRIEVRMPKERHGKGTFLH